MKKFVFAAAALCIAAVSNGGPAPTRVGDFALLDQKGYFHQMSYYDDRKAVALLVQANGSKATVKAIEDFKAAQSRHQDKVKFFMLNPLGSESRASVQKQVDEYGVDIPVLMDDTQLVAEALGVNKTGEVFLLNPGTTEVLYRGPVGKNFDRALDAGVGRQTGDEGEGVRARPESGLRSEEGAFKNRLSPIRRTWRRSLRTTVRAVIAKAASRRLR